jgi:hypothetical protein
MKEEIETTEYCLKDYKNRHYWESIGVITRQNGDIAQVYKCLQCKKCKLEILEQITRRC